MTELSFRDGIAHLDGRPVYLVTADYPYYRDDPALWRPKLKALRGLGALAVTSYIPWRHHELDLDGERRFDFEGATQANRDVRGFVALCADLQLPVILKPGPFCHAELNYGGLPDFACPLQRPDVPAARDMLGRPITWNGARLDADGRIERWPLPSFFAPAYAAEARRWLEAVARQVIRPASAPNGPVVAVQVGNEGLACDAQRPVWAADFSEPALAAFRTWLRRRNPDLAAYNLRHGTAYRIWRDVRPPRRWSGDARLPELARFAEWSEFLGDALGALLADYARALDVRLPALTNVNPPTAEPGGIDAWLSRVRPAGWEGLQYGFTNWIGIAADDPSVVDRYEVMAGVARGPNLEENWGFSSHYGLAFDHPVVSFHQTLAMIGAGATGYNLYTGAGTDRWDEALDCFNGRPYPDRAPIDAAGQPTAAAGVAALLGRFLAIYGGELLACRPQAGVAWGVDRPACWAAAWTDSAKEHGTRDGPPPTPGRVVTALQHRLAELGQHLAFIDLESASAQELKAVPLLAVAGGPTMAGRTQGLLADYGAGGGRLVVVGEVPGPDDGPEACAVLVETAPLVVCDADELSRQLSDLVDEARSIEATGGRAWLRVHPARDVAYLVALSDGATDLGVRFRASDGSDRRVTLRIAGGGGAMVRLEAGRPTATLLKGVDERRGRSVAPCLAAGGVELAADAVTDLLVMWSEGSWSAWTSAAEATADSYLAPTDRFRVMPDMARKPQVAG